MAVDEGVIGEIRAALAKRNVVAEEKRMFGGMCFLLDGHMVSGVTSKDQVMARVDPEKGPELARLLNAQPMTQGARQMWGFLLGSVDDVNVIVDASLAYVRTLPPKAVSGKKAGKKSRS